LEIGQTTYCKLTPQRQAGRDGAALHLLAFLPATDVGNVLRSHALFPLTSRATAFAYYEPQSALKTMKGEVENA
jgi:hypothetical protein